MVHDEKNEYVAVSWALRWAGSDPEDFIYFTREFIVYVC